MVPPDPLPFEDLYDEATLRRLGVELDLHVEVGGEGGVEPDHAVDLEPVGSVTVSGAAGPAGLAGARAVHRVRRSASGLMLAAAMSGVGEVLEPESRKVMMVELDPGRREFSDRPVEFLFVPGNPKASRIIVRPWLRAG